MEERRGAPLSCRGAGGPEVLRFILQWGDLEAVGGGGGQITGGAGLERWDFLGQQVRDWGFLNGEGFGVCWRGSL